MNFWVAFIMFYVVIGMLSWNILWLTHFRHRPGATEVMESLPSDLRIVKVATECVFWPILIFGGLWKTIYGRKDEGR